MEKVSELATVEKFSEVIDELSGISIEFGLISDCLGISYLF